jgi:hypothetical protein
MKKKLIAMGLVVVLTLSMSFTALAAGTNNSKKPSGGGSHSSSSSSDDDDSSSSSSSTASSSTTTNKNQETTVANAVPGGRVAPSTVSVAVVNADGTVSATNLGAVISATQATVAASAVSAPQAVATVQALMTTAPTEFFAKTVEALATMKGAAMVVNNCGTVKTAAVAADALGNNIASAGVIPNVTSGALVMLMSVNADGTVEYVEGVVDPVTGAVLGAFKGIPATITVLVFA